MRQRSVGNAAQDGRRVIVGIGRILKVDLSVEYMYEKGAPTDAMRCVPWEQLSTSPTMS